MHDPDFSMLELSYKGYFCSQILLSLALRAQGRENPGLVRALSGLANGTTRGKGVCGALTGAACLLAYYAGKGDDHEQESERLPTMLEEYWDWFEENHAHRYGGSTCGHILADGAEPRERCAPMVAEAFRRCQDILLANGFDPMEAADGRA